MIPLAEKIQQLRKQIGLSQEELAEKLNVSRQAVSKWESGACVPEVEKLIELSRLFGVSLDELLQLKSGEEGTEEDERWPDEFSEKQINAINDVVAYHVGEKDKKKKRKYFYLAGGAAAFFLICCVVLATRVTALNRQLGEIKNQMSGIESRIDGTLGSIRTQIEESLASQNSLVAAYEGRIAAADPVKRQMTLSLSVTPKEYTEGMKTYFSLSGEGFPAQKKEASIQPDNSFFAEATLPLSDSVQVAVIFERGDKQENQLLDCFYDVKKACQFTMHASWIGKNVIDQDEINLTGALNLDLRTENWLKIDYGVMKVAPKTGELQVLRNGMIVKSIPLDLSTPSGSPDDAPGVTSEESGYYGFSLDIDDLALSWADGDVFDLQAAVTDNYGIRYEYTAQRFTVSDAGELEVDWSEEILNQQTRIYYPE